jgi:hypothetical protein
MRVEPPVRKVVVAAPPPRESGFPPWAFVPIGVLGLVMLVGLFLLLRGDDDAANVNVNVDMAGRRTATTTTNDPPSSSTTVPSTGSQPVTVPDTTTTTVPGTQTAPPAAPPPDRGTVVINAQVAPVRGAPQAARNAKFYLLDQDLETILREARVEPIEGNSLTGSLGLAVVFPDRYGEFYRNAMRAIAAKSKYSGTTDGKGAASVSGIQPDQYYLFGITKVGNGFALWNAPIAVNAGQNVLNLSPQNVTEIPAG